MLEEMEAARFRRDGAILVGLRVSLSVALGSDLAFGEAMGHLYWKGHPVEVVDTSGDLIHLQYGPPPRVTAA